MGYDFFNSSTIAQPIETNLDKKFLILVVSKFEKYR